MPTFPIPHPTVSFLLTVFTLELVQSVSANPLPHHSFLKESLKATPTCQATSLKAGVEGWSQDAQQGLGVSFYLQNNSSRTCALPTANRVQIIDAAGRILPIQHAITSGFAGAPIPTNFILKPKEMIGGLFLWENWCRPLPQWNLSLKLLFPNNQGQLTVPIKDSKGVPLRATPRCNRPQFSSSLILQYLPPR